MTDAQKDRLVICVATLACVCAVLVAAILWGAH